jgi:hypothetical protein
MASAAFMPAACGDNTGIFQKSGFGPLFFLNDGCKQRQWGPLEYLTDRYAQGSLAYGLSNHLTGF